MKQKLKKKYKRAKLVNPYSDSSRKKESAQISTIRNEKGVTTNITEMQRIIRSYYKQLHINKMNNLEEINKFLEKYNLPRLNEEKTENMSISSNETDSIKKKQLSENKGLGADGCTGEFY